MLGNKKYSGVVVSGGIHDTGQAQVRRTACMSESAHCFEPVFTRNLCLRTSHTEFSQALTCCVELLERSGRRPACECASLPSSLARLASPFSVPATCRARAEPAPFRAGVPPPCLSSFGPFPLILVWFPFRCGGTAVPAPPSTSFSAFIGIGLQGHTQRRCCASSIVCRLLGQAPLCFAQRKPPPIRQQSARLVALWATACKHCVH